jgi:hypothetical protein
VDPASRAAASRRPGRGIATGVLSAPLGRVVSGPRRVVIRAVHPSRRVLGAHRRMTANARGQRLSIVRVLSVILRREQKLGRKDDGRSASTAIPLRHAQSALKGHASALMTADVKMTVNVRNRRRSIVRVRPVILARERTLAPKGDGPSASAAIQPMGARGAPAKRVNSGTTIGVRMTSNVGERRPGVEKAHSVTLRRPRSGPRRATANQVGSRRLGVLQNNRNRTSRFRLAVHPSRCARGAHLRMTVNTQERSHRVPTIFVAVLRVSKKPHPVFQPPCKTSPSPATKPVCESTAFWKHASRD